MSDADYCRSKGWTVGTQLIGTECGDDWQNTTTIELTAIGERLILAKTIVSHSKQRRGDGPWEERPPLVDVIGNEGSWTLSCRDWRPAS